MKSIVNTTSKTTLGQHLTYAQIMWLCSSTAHLFISPLRPKIPCECCSNPRKRKNHEQPKKAVNNVELSVEDIADPMDGASASVFLCGLNQGCFLQCILHCIFQSFTLCSLKVELGNPLYGKQECQASTDSHVGQRQSQSPRAWLFCFDDNRLGTLPLVARILHFALGCAPMLALIKNF